MHRLHEDTPWMRALHNPPPPEPPKAIFAEGVKLPPKKPKAAGKKPPKSLVTPKVSTHEPPGTTIITSQEELVAYFKEQGINVPPAIQEMMTHAMGIGGALTLQPQVLKASELPTPPSPEIRVGMVRGIMGAGTTTHYRTWYARTPEEAYVMVQSLQTLGMHILDRGAKHVPSWYQPDWLLSEVPKVLFNLTEEYSTVDHPERHWFVTHTYVTREEVLRFRGPHRFHVEDEARMGSFVDQLQMGNHLELEMKPLPPGADNKPRKIHYHRVVIDRIPV